jgi:hypothetical protein
MNMTILYLFQTISFYCFLCSVNGFRVGKIQSFKEEMLVIQKTEAIERTQARNRIERSKERKEKQSKKRNQH